MAKPSPARLPRTAHSKGTPTYPIVGQSVAGGRTTLHHRSPTIGPNPSCPPRLHPRQGTEPIHTKGTTGRRRSRQDDASGFGLLPCSTLLAGRGTGWVQ
jgi:hypothetical protein